MKRRLFAALFVCLLAGGAWAFPAVVDWSEDIVNLRAEPNTRSAKVGTLQKGAKAEVLKQETRDGREWSRIKSGSLQGWVLSKSLKPAAEEKAPKPAPAPAPAPVAAPAAVPPPPAPATPAPAAVPPPPAYTPSTDSAPTGGYLANVSERNAPPELDVGGSIFRMFSGLLLVLGLIGGLVWVLRRYMGGKIPGLQSAGAIRLLSSRPLGTRQALLLVEVGGEVYLLSQTEGSIELLTKIENPTAVDRLDYLFEFKASAFENELKRKVRDENFPGPSADDGGREPPKKGPSVEDRLAKLRSRFSRSGES